MAFYFGTKEVKPLNMIGKTIINRGTRVLKGGKCIAPERNTERRAPSFSKYLYGNAV